MNDWTWEPSADASPTEILQKCADLMGVVEGVLSGDDTGEGLEISGTATGGLLDIVRTARFWVLDVSNIVDYKCHCGERQQKNSVAS